MFVDGPIHPIKAGPLPHHLTHRLLTPSLHSQSTPLVPRLPWPSKGLHVYVPYLVNVCRVLLVFTYLFHPILSPLQLFTYYSGATWALQKGGLIVPGKTLLSGLSGGAFTSAFNALGWTGPQQRDFCE